MALGNVTADLATATLLEFGDFRIDTVERGLWRGERLIPITAKAFDVLLLLVRNAGRTVTKEEFMSEVWAGTIVEEANLTDNISTLRQALEDDSRQPKYIQTVPKRGYRFVAAVKPVSGAPAGGRKRGWAPVALGLAAAFAILAAIVVALVSRTPHRAAQSQGEPHSIAVLPFKPLTANDRDPAIEMGMTDALIAKLSRIRALSVRPTTAVMPYADQPIDIRAVAARLDVDSVLDGKLQKSGDRMRVSVQLVRAADGSTIWADRFDERFTDIFALQDAISERVAEALELRLSLSERKSLKKRATANSEAYQMYLNGMQQWRSFSPDGLLAAVNYHSAAIKLDPNFALAWTGLAKAYNVLGIWGAVPARDAFPKAHEAAIKGAALDPTIAETHIPVIADKLLYERDWEGAKRELDLAERLDPSLGDVHTLRGYYHQAMGRGDLALEELQRSLAASPDWQIAKNDVLQGYSEARRFAEGIEASRKAIALDPAPPGPHFALGDALAGTGRYEEAIEELQRAVDHSRSSPSRYMGTLAWCYARLGKREKALAIIDEMKRDRSAWMPMGVAEAYAGLGDHDQVFAWLNRACDEKFAFVWDIRNRHEFDGIRQDPRYGRILGRLRLNG
jgi:TolB-like protein/Flp pilus assembly protein TadD